MGKHMPQKRCKPEELFHAPCPSQKSRSADFIDILFELIRLVPLWKRHLIELKPSFSRNNFSRNWLTQTHNQDGYWAALEGLWLPIKRSKINTKDRLFWLFFSLMEKQVGLIVCFQKRILCRLKKISGEKKLPN